jgi:hypothetical protein
MHVCRFFLKTSSLLVVIRRLDQNLLNVKKIFSPQEIFWYCY